MSRKCDTSDGHRFMRKDLFENDVMSFETGKFVMNINWDPLNRELSEIFNCTSRNCDKSSNQTTSMKFQHRNNCKRIMKLSFKWADVGNGEEIRINFHHNDINCVCTEEEM